MCVLLLLLLYLQYTSCFILLSLSVIFSFDLLYSTELSSALLKDKKIFIVNVNVHMAFIIFPLSHWSASWMVKFPKLLRFPTNSFKQECRNNTDAARQVYFYWSEY